VAKDDHLVSNVGDKLGIVDAFTRTIKLYIQKYQTLHGHLRWTKYIGSLVDLYNDTPHEGLKGDTPNEAFDDFDFLVGKNKGESKYNARTFKGYKLKAGDRVRVMIGKHVFEKQKARFSTELYTIAGREGYYFVLTDEQGKAVKRRYRAGELLKVEGAVEDRVGNTKEAALNASNTHKKEKKIQRQMAPLQPIQSLPKGLGPRERRPVNRLDL
jgi:hypothetical protein